MLRIAAASLIALTVGAAEAQTNVVESDAIIVTGSGTRAASTESLQSVDVISSAEIFGAFAGSLGETLAHRPGVSTSSFGPAVGRPIIRGLGGDRVRILNNGIGAIDASAISSDHASSAEAIDAEQIEILRGPAAIAYGGNAAGGVINVIDGRIPSARTDGAFDGQLLAGATSVDDGRQIAGRLRANAGLFVLQLDGAHREAGDFEIPGFAESARLRALEAASEDEEEEGEEHAEARGVVRNSRYEFDTLGAGASIVQDWGFVGVSFRQFDADYGLPGHEHGHEEEEGEEGAEAEAEGDPRLVMEQSRWDVRGSAAVGWGPFRTLDFAAGFSDYEHRELEPDGAVGTKFTNEGWEGRIALLNGDGGPWSGSIGLQAFETDFSAVGEEAFVPPVKTQDIGVFAAQRYDRGPYGFEGGLRLETRELEPAAGASRSFDTISGAVGAFWRPFEGGFVGVNLARTERAPTDGELFSNGPHAATESFEIGDATLGKETALAFDVTAHLDRDDWHVEIGAFYTAYSDFIFLAPTDEEEDGLPVFRYRQDDATLWGGELLVERPIASFAGWTLSADAALEYVRAEADRLGNIPRIPPFAATFGVGLERAFADLRAEVEYVAEQDETASFELPTDDFTFVNFTANIYPLEGRNTRILVGALNVTDEEGRRHTSQLKDVVPLPGRSFRVALSQKF